MGQGKFDSRRFDVGDDEENHDRPDERDQRIRRLDHDLFDPAVRELARGQVLQVVDRLRDRARRDQPSARGRFPVEGPGENLLGHAARDEQGDPRSDPPFRDDLVHEEHEVRTSEELEDDEQFRQDVTVADRDEAEQQGSVQGRHEAARGREEAENLRDRLHEDHDDHEELLRSLVDALVFVVLEVQVDDLRAREQLHDDRGRDDRSDAEMHQGALGPREDRTETGEEIDHVRPVEAVDEDVRHGEIEDEDRQDPEHLGAELDVSFRTGHCREAVRQGLQGIEAAFLLLLKGHRSLPGRRGEDDFPAGARDLREGGSGGFRHHDPHRDRYPARA